MLLKRGEKQNDTEKNSVLRVASLENENTEEDDPFNMNVIFYDGEKPINDFKSREEFVDRELALENGKFDGLNPKRFQNYRIRS